MTKEINLFINKIFLEFHSSFIEWLPSLAMGLVVFLLFWFASKVFYKLIVGINKRSRADHKDIIELLAKFAKTAILIIGLVSALGSLGININAIIASLGLTGFAVGYAMKDALSNILAGIMILLYRPFKIGQFITTGTFSGIVKSINLRYTTIVGDEEIYLIPNTSLVSSPVVLKNTKENQ